MRPTAKSLSTTVRLRGGWRTDNRGSHFYLALYWAQALARQNSPALAASTNRSEA
jgi:monomeric isocitrate dehydrogenase